jgi:hypothetical protein
MTKSFQTSLRKLRATAAATTAETARAHQRCDDNDAVATTAAAALLKVQTEVTAAMAAAAAAAVSGGGGVGGGFGADIAKLTERGDFIDDTMQRMASERLVDADAVKEMRKDVDAATTTAAMAATAAEPGGNKLTHRVHLVEQVVKKVRSCIVYTFMCMRMCACACLCACVYVCVVDAPGAPRRTSCKEGTSCDNHLFSLLRSSSTALVTFICVLF